jgi:hypothetical protein
MYPETFHADYSRLEHTAFTRTRLRQLRALVVGAGALGNEVARSLGLLGVGQVTIVDPDVVEPSNLPRSIFFSPAHSGRNKASALVGVATVMFPDTGWAAIGSEIADVGFQRIRGSHLLFSCVDSDLARLETAYISKKLGLSVCDGGLGWPDYSHGRVTFFPGTMDGACFACMLTPRRRRELLEWWQATVRPCSPWNSTEAESASTPMMAAIVGSMQVELGLRSVFESEDGAVPACRSVEINIHPNRRIDEFTVPVSSECPFHEMHEPLRGTTHDAMTFAELLDSASSDTLLLDWPICTEAKCVSCNATWPPMQRVARLRRTGRCPACQSSQVMELKIIREIGRSSEWLHYRPSALGLPEQHMYSMYTADRLCGSNFV